MKTLIGMCGKYERFAVYWIEGEFISVPAVGSMICTDTRSFDEAVAICKRNLINFIEATR